MERAEDEIKSLVENNCMREQIRNHCTNCNKTVFLVVGLNCRYTACIPVYYTGIHNNKKVCNNKNVKLYNVM